MPTNGRFWLPVVVEFLVYRAQCIWKLNNKQSIKLYIKFYHLFDCLTSIIFVLVIAVLKVREKEEGM